jgi:hypothetical protein
MPSVRSSSATSRERPSRVVVLRIGSHPLIYSVVVILAVGAAAFFLAVVPLVRMIQPGGKAAVEDAQAALTTAQNTLAVQKKLADAASSLSTDERDMLAYALPATPDAPGLSIILKSLANASGLKLSSFDISEPPPTDGAATSVGTAEISLALDLVTYDRLKIFLLAAENSLRLFDLKTLTFSPGTGSAGIQLQTYYLNGT